GECVNGNCEPLPAQASPCSRGPDATPDPEPHAKICPAFAVYLKVVVQLQYLAGYFVRMRNDTEEEFMPMQVCMGAMMQCSFGMAPSSLVVLPKNTTFT